MDQFSPLSRGLESDRCARRGGAGPHVAFAGDRLRGTDDRGGGGGHRRGRDRIFATIRELRFISFIDLCGVDYPEREKRFDVVYHLLEPDARTTASASSSRPMPTRRFPSISDVFPAATWFEREAYDFYGILFSGNPDFRRILTDYGFRGHPLRKDFPLTGFVEVRYSNEQRRVVYEPVRLPQEFRSFDFLSPWEGTDYVLPGDEKARPADA